MRPNPICQAVLHFFFWAQAFMISRHCIFARNSCLSASHSMTANSAVSFRLLALCNIGPALHGPIQFSSTVQLSPALTGIPSNGECGQLHLWPRGVSASNGPCPFALSYGPHFTCPAPTCRNSTRISSPADEKSRSTLVEPTGFHAAPNTCRSFGPRGRP